ncbi:MAG: sugar nucleotide-binding protein, partial [Nitrososphaeria archaeon]
MAEFGGTSMRKNFVVWAYRVLKDGKTVRAVKQRVSPTLNSYLARAVREIAERELEGIYHIAGAEAMSRYEMAMKVKEHFGLSGEVVLADKIESWKARRPEDSSLSVERARKDLENKPIGFIESIVELVREVKL